MFYTSSRKVSPEAVHECLFYKGIVGYIQKRIFIYFVQLHLVYDLFDG